MEALFRDNVRNTWRPRALARMTAALQRKQEELAALGTPPTELNIQHVWETVVGRVDLEGLCNSIRTKVRSPPPSSTRLLAGMTALSQIASRLLLVPQSLCLQLQKQVSVAHAKRCYTVPSLHLYEYPYHRLRHKLVNCCILSAFWLSHAAAAAAASDKDDAPLQGQLPLATPTCLQIKLYLKLKPAAVA